MRRDVENVSHSAVSARLAAVGTVEGEPKTGCIRNHP